ncbi:larval cuticle protein 9 [Drosophila guanche]|uniref:Blast:Larval cuticle protein 9 n=1 Tax=Drosophila guanche TaxID=7266 RepID=A0A3B0JGN7_DROGU|nr:larval cuticle protein 9 [Drosophila guanche]SPP74520.1 blast:Larval cuticle protein 9 [Drosophila guanche]
MKFVIVLACLLALAYANEEADVLKNDSEVNVEDFKYAYELSNHIKAVQSGVLKEHDNWVVSGEYEYVAPNGQLVKVVYTADETGYHPKVVEA